MVLFPLSELFKSIIPTTVALTPLFDPLMVLPIKYGKYDKISIPR